MTPTEPDLPIPDDDDPGDRFGDLPYDDVYDLENRLVVANPNPGPAAA